MLLNLALWIGGAVLTVLGIYQARDPYARLQGLKAVDANARRYADWRGGTLREEQGGVTGADVMRQMLGGRLRIWGAIAVLGVALIVAGFVLR
ncbi:MAG: hypothetical protein H0W07_01685 [Chloroflexi bacterium]|nr:hypothetical protein [Chloroflexota bacterium]